MSINRITPPTTVLLTIFPRLHTLLTKLQMSLIFTYGSMVGCEIFATGLAGGAVLVDNGTCFTQGLASRCRTEHEGSRPAPLPARGRSVSSPA